jgi:hypothetical protein
MKVGHENIFNEEGEKVYDPMEYVLTHIDDPNIVLKKIAEDLYLGSNRNLIS